MEDIKFENWRLTGFWIGATLASLIAGFVLGWGWRDRPGALASVSVLNVITALGTVGATFAAVGIASWQYRLQQKEKYVDAVLVLGEAYPRMARFLAALIATEPFFEELKYVDRSPEAIRQAVSLLRQQYDAANFPSPRQLIPLGGRFGADLALIVSHLQSALELAESDNLRTREDRLHTAGFMRGAIGVAMPRIQALSEAGFALLNQGAEVGR
ncbi:hypothetical protein [Achromobacter mucicolens]|uniref:hypothetical protein n=1 Tax=Achromobacter mucicolens TaxID=1389922 RepID=UPI001CBE0812|nr:hypothetical protein [Achromobacter mucicolens]UAN03033.1 hypothetical protein K9D24_02300 [Achromobacter mucicolens]